MSDIDELEAYETLPPPIDGVHAARGRRNFKKAIVTARESHDRADRKKYAAERTLRGVPSLPRLKFLEHGD